MDGRLLILTPRMKNGFELESELVKDLAGFQLLFVLFASANSHSFTYLKSSSRQLFYR